MQDYVCATEKWSSALRMYPRSLIALAGLAKIQLRAGNKSSAFDYASQGQNISKNFIPFWNLMNEEQK